MKHDGMIVSVSQWVPGHRGEAYTGTLRSSRCVSEIPALRRGSWGPAIERCLEGIVEQAREKECNAVVCVEIHVDIDALTVSAVGHGVQLVRSIEPLPRAHHEVDVEEPRAWWRWLSWWAA